MVVFTCQHCGESVNKPRVEKHYNTKCRFKEPFLTCVDCLKDFRDNEYDQHKLCVSEAERYAAKGTKFKECAGRNKQTKYVEMIQSLLNSKDLSLVQRNLLEVCSTYDNVPRKLKKFKNFMANAGRTVKHTAVDLETTFKILEDAWKKETERHAQVTESNQSITETQSTKEDKDSTDEINANNSITNSAESNNASVEKKKKKKHRSKDAVVEESGTVTANGFNEPVIENDEQQEASAIESTNTKKKTHKKETEANLDNDMLTEDKEFVEDHKENINTLSKKELKKLKKQKKYLLELENASKVVLDENVLNHADDNNKKKSKKNKHQADDNESEKQEVIETNSDNTIKPIKLKNKKSKKRKLDDLIYETNEKRTRLEVAVDEDIVMAPVKFDWTDVIMRVLQSRPDKELSLKRLGKKVIDEYLTVKADHHSFEELLAKFNKKVHKTKGVKVLRDRAKLIEQE